MQKRQSNSLPVNRTTHRKIYCLWKKEQIMKNKKPVLSSTISVNNYYCILTVIRESKRCNYTITGERSME